MSKIDRDSADNAGANRSQGGATARGAVRVGTGHYLVGVVLLLGLVLVRMFDPGPLQILRLNAFDLLQRLDARSIGIDRVLVVDIDDDSLSAIGQWPWPRDRLAALVDRLAENGATVIGFDILLTEPDSRLSDRVAEMEAMLGIDLGPVTANLPDGDALLAQSLANSRVVLAAAGRNGGSAPEPEHRPLPGVFVFSGGDHNLFLPTFGRLLRSVAALDSAAAGHGAINYLTERDSVIRRMPAVIRGGDSYLPALAIEMIRAARDLPNIVLHTDSDIGVRGLALGATMIPTDATGQVWLHFAEPNATDYASAADVLSGTVAASRIDGKFVLIGSTAAGLADTFATPIGHAVPGIEVHAQLLQSLLDETFLVRPATLDGPEIAGAIVLGLLFILLLPRLSARRTIMLSAAVAVAVLFLSWYLYAEQRLLYDPTFPILLILILTFQLGYAGYRFEERQRQHGRIESLKLLGNAIAMRDDTTHYHSYRVTLYAIAIAEALSLPRRPIQQLIKGAFLHDIGKIGIPDAILLKRGTLDRDERLAMNRHVDLGAEIIAVSDWLADGGEVVRHHHERVDGTGYPAGLRGDDIPIIARIFAIADTFDALTSVRPYKDEIPYEAAMAMLERDRGSHFDARILDAFKTSSDEMHVLIGGRQDRSLEQLLDRKLELYFNY